MPAFFSINNQAYIAGGRTQNLTTVNTVWNYNAITDEWSEYAAMPFRKAATAHFSIGDKGYVLGGFNTENEIFTSKDVLEFSPSENLWTIKGDFPGDPIQFGGSFTIGDNAYIIGANSSVNDFGKLTKDVWRYNQTEDYWTKMNDFPGEARLSAVAFSSERNGYFGMGTLVAPFIQKEPVNDFWRYEPLVDEWTQIADFPGTARIKASIFTANNSAFIGMGVTESNIYPKDFYKLDLATHTWEAIDDFRGESRINNVSFEVNNVGFIGMGNRITNGSPTFNDMWVYKD